ncbi:zinc ribbon domain-containing protein [Butyrivibrio proteoclasticus]|uniref:zinc ribbon domain-containing protein n=1 Tax=Butyrivibrio proteoclasticus TaxID=43305 RepID=UPI00047AB2F4|nr:zinc ribbon domain-containing protein [Butyrivibrio proteoclasticus]
MLCPNCGNQIDDHSSSCPYCGYSFGYNGETVLLGGQMNGNNQYNNQFDNQYNNQFNNQFNNDQFSGQYSNNNDPYSGQYNGQYQDQFQNQFQNQFQDQNGFGGQFGDQYQNGFDQNMNQYQNGYDQNSYGHYNDQYQGGYDQYGYQDPYYNNVQQPKKKHTVLKTVLILILVVAVGFGGFKGWKYLSNKMGTDGAVDVAVTASSEQLQAIEDLKALMTEMDEYIGDYCIGGEDTDGDEACEQMHTYYDQFAKMKNLPTNVQTATDTCIKAIVNAYDVYYANAQFYDDFEEIAEQMTELKIISTYDEACQYYNSNTELISSLKQQLDQLDCPPGYTYVVSNISSKLQIMDDYMYQIGVGVTYDDLVRISSGLSVGAYFFQKVSDEIAEFANYIYYSADQLEAQSEKIGALFDEIVEVLDKDYSEIVTYEFQNSTDKIVFNYEAVENIYPSLYNSYDYFLLFKAQCFLGEQDIVVECNIDGLTETYKQTFHVTNDILFIPIKPAADTSIMNDITATDTDMNVTITTKDGTVLDTQTFSVHIADQNSLEFYEEDYGFCNCVNTLCYLTPSSESISNLKRNAIDILSDMTEGQMTAFAGYQGPMMGATYIDTYYYAASVMLALQQNGITVTDEYYDVNETSQTIQFPEETISSGSGSAMDVAMVIASALQSSYMNTYLVMSEEHVYVLLETWDQDCMYLLIDPAKINADRSMYDDSGKAIMQQTILMDTEYPIHILNDELWNYYMDCESLNIVNCSDGSVLGLAPFAH